jgi:hypothetical protein
MRLLCVTDLHGNAGQLTRILVAAGPVDVVLLGGDITDFGSPWDAEKILQLVASSGVPTFCVAGNCDSAEIDARLRELGVSVSGRGILCGDMALHGVSGMPPWKPGMYHFTEEQIHDLLETGYRQATGRWHVVLAHFPPRDTALDHTLFGRHVGSAALRSFIENTRPNLVLCGHIHEARGIDQLGPTTVVNCGFAAVGQYAIVELTDRVEVALHVAYRSGDTP